MLLSPRTPGRVLLFVLAALLTTVGSMKLALGDALVRNPPDPTAPAASGGGARSAGATRAALAGGQSEIYTGIKPCRILDTRATSPLVDGSRTFQVSGSLTAQGGLDTCGIPTYATSVAVNLTGIAVDGGGFVRGWASGDTPATATLLNVAPSINASNLVNIPLCRGETCTSAFTLRAYGGAHLVGDAVGYFTQPLYVSLASDGSVYQSIESGVVSSTRAAAGVYDVQFVRPVLQCDAQATDAIFDSLHEISVDQTFGAADVVRVDVRNPSGDHEDTSFNLVVTC